MSVLPIQVSVQGVQATAPEAAVGRKPAFQLGQAISLDLVDSALAVGADTDQPGFSQGAQVLGGVGLADGEKLDQVPGRTLAAAQQVQNAPTIGLGHGFESVHEDI